MHFIKHFATSLQPTLKEPSDSLKPTHRVHILGSNAWKHFRDYLGGLAAISVFVCAFGGKNGFFYALLPMGTEVIVHFV